MIPSWHTQIPGNKLGEESQIESNEHQPASKLCPWFRIELASDLRPVEMKAAKESHDRPADHDVVEMSYDKIRVMQMNIKTSGGQKYTSQTTNEKQTHEADYKHHRGLIRNRSFVQRRRPVERFDR